MRTILILAFCIFSSSLFSQVNINVYSDSRKVNKNSKENSDVKLLDRFKDIFNIGNTYDDFSKSFDAKNPASVYSNLILNNKDSVINYTQIDAAVGVDLFSVFYQIFSGDISSNITGYGIKLLPFAEYHKSTYDKNKTALFKFGGSVNTYYIFNGKLEPKISASACYNDARNYLEDEFSHQSKIDFSISFNKEYSKLWSYLLPYSDMVFIKKGKDTEFHWIDFMYLPSIGIEYNDIYRSGRYKSGYNLTNYYRLNGIILLVKKIFHIQAEVEWRNVFKNTVKDIKKTTNYGSLSFDIDVTRIFDVKKAALLLGIEYFNGENPWLGINMTKKLQFAIKAKL